MEEENGGRKADADDHGPKAGKAREAESSHRHPFECLHRAGTWYGYRAGNGRKPGRARLYAEIDDDVTDAAADGGGVRSMVG